MHAPLQFVVTTSLCLVVLAIAVWPVIFPIVQIFTNFTNAWAHYSGNFYSGLFRLWVAIAEIGTDAIMSRWPILLIFIPKAMGSSAAEVT